MESGQALGATPGAAPQLLLIDTATDAFSVAVAFGEQVIAQWSSPTPRAHAAHITSGCARVLADAGWAPRQLHAIAVSLGPGSYTGLRIGLAAAKAMCQALGIPLLPVSALLGLAELGRSALGAEAEGITLWPMIDARRLEVYTAAYSITGLAIAQQLAPHARVLSAADLASWPRPWAAVGTGAAKLRTLIAEGPDQRVLDSIVSHATGLLPEALACWHLGAGLLPGPALDALEPYYLKPVHVGGPGAFDAAAADPR